MDESLIELTKKYGPERDLCVQRFKQRNGYVKSPKVYAMVLSIIDMIVIRRKPLAYVKAVVKNSNLKPAERSRVMKLVRTAFPKDYFKDRARKAYAAANPFVIKRAINDRQLMLEFTHISESS